MAHFAYVQENIVQRVHTVNNSVITDETGIEQEKLGQQFLSDLHGYNPKDIIQCSYNGQFRGAFPGKGWRYDPNNDLFLPIEDAPLPE